LCVAFLAFALSGTTDIIVQLRPYTPESTGSRLISKVKLVMAQSVLWWGTTREYWVLKFFTLSAT
jgi:hypothetical protein